MAIFERWVDMLVQHVAGKRLDLALPLDVQATAFQRRVWQELRAIPYGGTRSYGRLPRRLETPMHSRSGASLRLKPGGSGCSLPPGRARRRWSGRLPVGRGSQASSPGTRKGQTRKSQC